MEILVLFFIFLIVIIVVAISLTNKACDKIDEQAQSLGKDLGEFLHHISKK